MAKKPLKTMEAIASDEAESGEDTPLYNPEIYAEEPKNTVEAKTMEFDSHLFKLEVAMVKKNTGVTSDSPHNEPKQFEDLEHVHMFRTRDSDGRQPVSTAKAKSNPKATVLKTTAIAGHFHLVEVVPHPDKTKPPIITYVSPPMMIGKVKRNGKFQQVEVALNEYDHHSHKVAYRRTDKVRARTKNLEAAKVMALEGSKGRAPEGVI